MRLHLTSLAVLLVLTLAATSCTQQAPEPGMAGSADAAQTPLIRFGLNNNISSGLPVLHPAIMTLDKGKVTAFRAGSPDADEALAAIKAGAPLEDAQDQQHNIQAAFEKLLEAENIALDTVADPSGKTIVLFSPDASLGECTPCTELFQGLEAGGVIDGFGIRKVVIEHR